jgi:DNA-binding PadR family transcriptional regulator
VSLPAAGPLPRFTDAQIRRALELIAERKGIGRKQLARELGIGEGSIRTILNRLKERSFITSNRSGQLITAKGRRELGKTLEYVQIDAGDLTVGDVDVATIVRKSAARVSRGIEQRDEAIKAGAAGATVLVYKSRKLQFPDGFQEVKQQFANKLMMIFKLREGDVIIIGSAGDALKAEAGAKAAARSLL